MAKDLTWEDQQHWVCMKKDCQKSNRPSNEQCYNCSIRKPGGEELEKSVARYQE